MKEPSALVVIRSEPLAMTKPAPVSPVTFALTVKVSLAQATETEVTLASPTVPLPLLTTHVC